MASLLVLGLVTVLPLLEEQPPQATPSRLKVFLAEARTVRVQPDCAAAVATALTAGIAETKDVVPARSAADADVVVQMKECRIAVVPKVGGGVSITASTGGLGRGLRTETSIAVHHNSVARVLLAVDDQGRPKEFASRSDELPLDEAAQSATALLLAWIEKRNAR